MGDDATPAGWQWLADYIKKLRLPAGEDEEENEMDEKKGIADELRRIAGHDLVGCRSADEAAEAIYALADRIDREMVELPKDADGLPIHVGDTVYLDDGRKAKVARIQLSEREHSIGLTVCGDFFALWPEDLTYTNPDSWERIADELEEWSEDNRVNGDGEVFKRARQLSDRIRKLAKRKGE